MDKSNQSLGDYWSLTKRFFVDLGFGTTRIDRERAAKSLAENLKIKQEIVTIQNDIRNELTELHDRADYYIHAADTAKNIFHDAEYFVASNLLRFVRPKNQR